jgi:glycosyltransferase involved in cell wall biosynthesis
VLSVLITVFEQRVSLEMLLYCLRAQTIDEPFEVIICDDGSSDESFSSIRANPDFLGLDIRYIWQSKAGYRAARSKNNGIRCARGDLLVFLDGDILIKPDFLSRHRSAHHSSKQIACNPRRWVSAAALPSKVPVAQCKSDSSALPSQLLPLAKSDITRLFGLLERISIDNDRARQQMLFSSEAPWMACIGFSFSADRGPETYFDENFEGWGPEDREFALRMVKKNGYTIFFDEQIQVFHLEACSTGRASFSGLPNSPPQILSYLKNMVYFRAMYPNEDLSRVMKPLMNYRFNSASKYWELSPDTATRKRWSVRDLAAKISSVEEWLRANSLFPNVR